MKILLLGKNGQVGWELQRSLAPLGSLIALDRASADLADPESLRRIVRDVRPTIIVNAAAYTAVDKAESEPELAHMVNAVAPAVLAEEAEALGAWLVHYSTDYVFDGSGDSPWKETDTTNPLSVYGRTKLAGEKAVAQCEKHLIFRTSWVYAARGGNFAKTMLRLAREREKLSVVSDQIGAPTGAELIADVTAQILPKILVEQGTHAGVYNLAAAGHTSWYDYAKHVIEHARREGIAVKVAQDAILPITSEAYPVPADRPKNSRLNLSKIESTFALSMPDWHLGVERMLSEVFGN